MEEINPFYCTECQMSCNNITNFKKHIKKRHPTKMQQYFSPEKGAQSSKICDNCEGTFTSARSLASHRRWCTTESNEDKTVVNTIGKTKSRVDDDAIACSDCELEFDDLVTFKQHMRDHRDNRITKKRKRNGSTAKQTPKTERKSYSETSNHGIENVKEETHTIEIDEPEIINENQPTIRKSRRSRKIVSYAYLIQSSDSENEMSTRKMSERLKRSDLKPKNKHVCKECHMEYDDAKDLQKHTRKHHPSKLEKSQHAKKHLKETKIIINRKFICEDCSAKYNNLNNLRQHIRKYHPIKWAQLAPKLHSKTLKKSEKTYTCTECQKTYGNIVGLRKHIRKYHISKMNELTSGMYKKKAKSNEKSVKCDGCQARFVNLNNLKKHIKKQHFDKLAELMPKLYEKRFANLKRDIACSECEMKYSSMSGLRKHTRKHHQNKLVELAPLLYTFKRNIAKNILLKRRNMEEFEMMKMFVDCDLADLDKYKCNICDSSYSNISNLRKHLRKFHPERLAEVAPLLKDNMNYKFMCSLCPKRFNCIRNFKYHERKCHPEFAQPVKHNTKPTKINKCPLCVFENTERKKLLEHFKDEHDIEVTMNPVDVTTMEEFSQWKDTFEKDTNTRFVKEYHFSCASHDVVSYICHRSGYYNPKGKGLRHMKAQGSSKINGYCPAAMKVKTMKDNTVKVTFCGTHIGHTTDVSHLHLTPAERQTIAEKIAQNIPFKAILESMRESASESDSKRMHMLSKKDLYNIKSSFHLTSTHSKSEKMSQHENISFEVWIEDMKKCGDSILFHKPQGQLIPEHPYLLANDFVLIIMNQTQREKLRKFGHDTICIDRSFDVNSYHFELTTLLVLNDTEEGFPCVFLVSNRSDEEIMTLFFHYIKANVGDINPKIFMSDMANYFYKAWVSIMPNTELSFRYYCVWQIEHSWRRKLSTMKSKDKQESIMGKLKKVLEEKHIDSFKRALELAITTLSVESHSWSWDFSNYLMKNYINNADLWPTTEEPFIDIKDKSLLERMHKTLKHLFLNGKNAKHFGKALGDIMRFIKDKLFDRTILINRGKINNKMKIAIFRHKLSLHSKTDKITMLKEKGGWQVPCSDTGENYIVTEIQPMCRCEFICPECKCCVHRYLCTCLDSTVKWNMCKHIHLLCRYLSSPEYLQLNVQQQEQQQQQQQEQQQQEEEIVTQIEQQQESYQKQETSQQLLYLKSPTVQYIEHKTQQMEQRQQIEYIKELPQGLEYIKDQSQQIEYIKPQQHIKYIKQQPHIEFIKHQPQDLEYIKQSQPEHVQIQHIQLENHVGHVDQVESAYIYCNETNQREMDAILAEVNICNLETVQVTQVTQIPTTCTIQIPTSCTVVPQVAQITGLQGSFGEVVDTKESLKMKFLKLLEEASSPSELEVVQKMLTSITPTLEVMKDNTTNEVLFPL